MASIRILVIDDYAPYRSFMRRVFRELRYECEDVGSPEDASRLLEVIAFDAALVEIVSSFGSPNAVLKVCEESGVPCIVTTALPEAVARMYCPPSMPILTKPLNLRVLVAMLERITANSTATIAEGCKVES